jgi:hypothetical protein
VGQEGMDGAHELRTVRTPQPHPLFVRQGVARRPPSSSTRLLVRGRASIT